MTVSALGSHHHLADDLAVLDQPQPFARLLERQHLVDHRLHLALLDQLHQASQVLVVEAVRADQLELSAPDVCQAFIRFISSGAPADQDPAATLETAQRLVTGLPASEADHDIAASSL